MARTVAVLKSSISAIWDLIVPSRDLILSSRDLIFSSRRE
jgi:hypothetical protein